MEYAGSNDDDRRIVDGGGFQSPMHIYAKCKQNTLSLSQLTHTHAKMINTSIDFHCFTFACIELFLPQRVTKRNVP